MKKKGNCCDFISQRDVELRRVCRRHISRGGVEKISGMWGEVSKSPASRFYVSEHRMYALIRHRKKYGHWPNGERINAQRFAMYEEIWRRFTMMQLENPDMGDMDVIIAVVNSEAPSFYLTPQSMRTIYYRN